MTRTWSRRCGASRGSGSQRIMPSLITLPIRLPLEITYRAAKLGLGVVRTVAGILDRDGAERAHAAEGGGSDAPWPSEERFVAEPVAVEEVEHVEARVAFNAPLHRELRPDRGPALAFGLSPVRPGGAPAAAHSARAARRARSHASGGRLRAPPAPRRGPRGRGGGVVRGAARASR